MPPRAHTNLGLSCFINTALLALYAPTAVAVQLHALADACAADYLPLWQRARNVPHTQPHLHDNVALATLLSITFRCSMRPPNNKAPVPRLITDLSYKATREDVMEFLDRTLLNVNLCPQVTTPCAGQTTSTLHCRHCSYSYSVATEPFHTLHLPIIDEAGIPLRTVTAALHAHESLRSFDDHDHSWECSSGACQALGLHRNIPRHRRSVSHSPPVLVLHLLRWTHLGPHLHAVDACETIQLANSKRYRLCSIICHRETNATISHYTNVCRCLTSRGEWWYYDNQERRLASRAERRTTAKDRSYVLFYEQTS